MEHLMRRKTGLQIAGGALALLAVAALSSAASAQEVGKASAVNPAATANMRTITIGASITHKERIKTEAKGSVQLLFVDKTSMTIGPNSDLTIDEYVYNPNAGSGKLAATLSKGALRFVGGQISHSGDAEIKTASAVIGIRGGVAMIGQQHVYAGYGTSTVTSGGGTVTLGAGEYTELPGGGGPPTPPNAPPPGFVLAQIQMFQSAAGQTGGAGKGTASQGNVARAENRATGKQGGSVAGPLNPTPQVQPLPPINTVVNGLIQTIQTSQQSAVVQTIPHDAPDPRPTLTLSGWVSGLMQSVRGGGSSTVPILGLAQVALNGTDNRVQANFDGVVLREENDGYYSPYSPGRFNYQFGFQNTSENASSDYANYDNFSAQAAIQKNGTVVSTIDGYPITDHTGQMVSVTPAQARQYVTSQGRTDSTTYCTCDYTRWGVWGSESRQFGYTDTVAGFWVAGRPVQVSDIPATGTATYGGHVVAAIQNGNQQYLAGGDLTNTVNFGTRSGTSTVTNFDNTNYSGTLVINQSDPRFLGASLTGGDRTMVLTGSFFKGATNPVGEMGGSVLVTGSNYVGGGIFAAKMK
jgi:hypothetical protein